MVPCFKISTGIIPNPSNDSNFKSSSLNYVGWLFVLFVVEINWIEKKERKDKQKCFECEESFVKSGSQSLHDFEHSFSRKLVIWNTTKIGFVFGFDFFLWKFWIENYFTMDKEGTSSKIFEIDCALSSPRLLPLKSSIVKWFKSVLKVILDEIIVSKKVEMLRKKLPLKSGNDSSLFLLRFNFSAFIKVARIVINFWIYFWKQKTVKKKVTEVSRNGRQFAIWKV